MSVTKDSEMNETDPFGDYDALNKLNAAAVSNNQGKRDRDITFWKKLSKLCKYIYSSLNKWNYLSVVIITIIKVVLIIYWNKISSFLIFSTNFSNSLSC